MPTSAILPDNLYTYQKRKKNLLSPQLTKTYYPTLKKFSNFGGSNIISLWF